MFLDTSGLLCFHHRAEPQHADAVRFFQVATRRLTHSYVLAEFVALAQARKLPRVPALSFVADLQDNTAVEVVYVGEALHRAALDLLRQRPDKPWSLCDAVSFVLMAQERIVDALTTDRHFEQAGFVRLLKPKRRPAADQVPKSPTARSTSIVARRSPIAVKNDARNGAPHVSRGCANFGLEPSQRTIVRCVSHKEIAPRRGKAQ
jgi:predicted nucleic acid-binding protein